MFFYFLQLKCYLKIFDKKIEFEIFISFNCIFDVFLVNNAFMKNDLKHEKRLLKKLDAQNNKVTERHEENGDFEELSADVCIIGAGLAGLLCAEELSNRGYKVCVLEADKVGQGDSPNSSGMVTFAHGLIYDGLITKHGEEVAKKFLELSKYGANKVKQLIKENSINCDLKECDMYLFSTTKKGGKDLLKEYEAYKTLGEECELLSETVLPFKVNNALRIKNQAIIDPGKYVNGLFEVLKEKKCYFF